MSQRLTNQERRLRWSLIGLAALFAVSLGLSSHERPLPLHCLFQWMTGGIPSPTCGMTRSLVALLRGQWELALSYHLFSPIALLGGSVILAGMLVELWRGCRLPMLSWWQCSIVWVPGAIAFFGYYGLRLYLRYDGTLPFVTANPSVWHWLVIGAKSL